MEWAALIGLFGALVAAVVQAVYAEEELRRKEVLDLAAFIEIVSELLLGMHKKLSNGEVPTVEGNQLKQVLKGYADVVAKSRISKKSRNELENVLPKLEELLTTAEFEDEIIRGTVLTYDPGSRDKLLQELKRTAGELRGMSNTLKGGA